MLDIFTKKLFSKSSVFFSIVSIFYGFKETDFEFPISVNYFLVALMCLLFCVDFIQQHYRLHIFIILSCLFFIASYSFVASGTSVFLISVMSAIVISHADFIWCFKLIFFERLLCNLFINFASIIGLLPMYVTLRKNNIPVLCYSFGYYNPNKFACVVGMLILLFICIKNVNITFFNIFFIALLDVIIYILTQSRTFLFAMFVCLVLVLSLKFQICKSLFKAGIYLLMPVCMLFSVVIPYLLVFGPSVVQKFILYFDIIFSGRFSHSSHVLELYPVNLFGGIEYFERLQNVFGYSVVDNGYIRLLYGYGLVGVSLFLFFYFKSVCFFLNNHFLIYFVIPIAVFTVWAISENVIYSVAYNFSILFWGIVLNPNNSSIKRISQWSSICPESLSVRERMIF